MSRTICSWIIFQRCIRFTLLWHPLIIWIICPIHYPSQRITRLTRPIPSKDDERESSLILPLPAIRAPSSAIHTFLWQIEQEIPQNEWDWKWTTRWSVSKFGPLRCFLVCMWLSQCNFIFSAVWYWVLCSEFHSMKLCISSFQLCNNNGCAVKPALIGFRLDFIWARNCPRKRVKIVGDFALFEDFFQPTDRCSQFSTTTHLRCDCSLKGTVSLSAYQVDDRCI